MEWWMECSIIVHIEFTFVLIKNIIRVQHHNRRIIAGVSHKVFIVYFFNCIQNECLQLAVVCICCIATGFAISQKIGT